MTSEVTSSRNLSSTPFFISGTRKATNFKFGWYIHRVHPSKSLLKICEKRERGVSRDGPNFSSTPYYLRNAQSYELQIWHVYSHGLYHQKPFKNFGDKGALAYPGTVEIIPVPPIISGTRRATNFKFGTYIHRVYPSKSLLKIWEKRERWTAEISSVFPIISGMGKATKFKFGRYIHRVHANQRHLRMWEKRERWRIQGLDKYPLLSPERIKFGKYIQRVHANKRPLKI